jgi:hypothetical protein
MRILRGLSSRFLPCGCLAGVYETYDAAVVSILDVKGSGCVNPAHQIGKILPADPAVEVPTPAPDTRDPRPVRD